MSALVSIVIPCYKGSRFLAKTIESCLGQTYRDIEVIVVDDKSPQNDAEIADSYAAKDSRIRVVRRERNGGVSRAYNSGYAIARGEYFTRLSQDDLFREDAIEIMLKHLQSAARSRPDLLRYAKGGRRGPMAVALEPGRRSRQRLIPDAGSGVVRDVAAERIRSGWAVSPALRFRRGLRILFAGFAEIPFCQVRQ